MISIEGSFGIYISEAMQVNANIPALTKPRKNPLLDPWDASNLLMISSIK